MERYHLALSRRERFFEVAISEMETFERQERELRKTERKECAERIFVRESLQAAQHCPEHLPKMQLSKM
jgi:hypothetical protein